MSNVVLVINCGSSSVKFALIDPITGETPLKGVAERLGDTNQAGEISIKYADEKTQALLSDGTHLQALQHIVSELKASGWFDKVVAIGHRVVHGGEYFAESVVIDTNVRNKIAECINLAPLHNPANVTGIDAAREAFPHLPQIAVFDTAFHQQMPEKAYLYALPYQLYQQHSIRRYGFHGTSFRYIADRAKALLPDYERLIIAHLGNGGSVAAVSSGCSLDTTMGLTPLEGIVHGTRSGDIDPAIPGVLASQLNIGIDEVTEMLWKQSGLLGLSELSNDCRTLEQAATDNNLAAQRALDVYTYRLAKHIAAQMVAIGGADALIFTGGIGENSAYVRSQTVKQLGFMGLAVDEANNAATIRGAEANIASANSTPIWVIPTNEELMIARDTQQLIED